MNDAKSLLLVAFHFPPFGGGSGVHRAANFARYLSENGWSSSVLTADTRAYETVNRAHNSPVPDGAVTRAFALDAQRHLAFRGRYLQWSALPDRWGSWALGAIPAGLAAVSKRKTDVIMVTFPIATAVLIGVALQVLTRKPLVVDFRDSMTEDGYPRDPLTRWVSRRIEKAAIRRAALLIFTTQSTRRMYLKRYPELTADRCVVISNGYDEDDFNGIAGAVPVKTAGRPFRLVHAGVIYTDDRDPSAFFRALGRLKSQGAISAQNLRIDLRASGSETYYADLLRQCGVEDIVFLLPSLSHREAVQDSAAADGLLLFQAASCNHQIPAKVYEYFRIGKPIFALTPQEGDTGVLLASVGGATIADLDDEEALVQKFPEYLNAARGGIHPLPSADKVQKYTRRNQTAELARCLDRLVCGELPGGRLASASDGTAAPPA